MPQTNGGAEPISFGEKEAFNRRGFSDDDLFSMSPQHARDILADKSRTPATERYRVVGEVMRNTACLVCGGSNNGVWLIKDTRQGGKPVALHPDCAAEWFENEHLPL